MVKLSNGNGKIGTIPNVSMPPIKACGNCRYCKKSCYALKAYRNKGWPSVRIRWNANFAHATRDLQSYFQAIQAQLARKRKLTFFRWHVSGDILSQGYLEGMIAIALKFPECRFLAFTKMFSLDYGNVPANLSIVFSMWPGMRKPRARCGVAGFAWVQDGTESRIPSSTITCPGSCENCGMCWEIHKLGGHVVFDVH